MYKNWHVILKDRPGVNGEPNADNFRYCECAPPSDPENGEILVKTCYLSVDPAQRCQMNEDTGVHYLKPWAVGETIIGLGGIGVVIQSQHGGYQAGDLVQGSFHWPWSLYFVLNPNDFQGNFAKVDTTLVGNKPNLVLSLLGLTGLTSLLGIREKGHISPSKNQTFVVSGAAGSCGTLAGQIARLEGCTGVVGICGTDEKCKMLTADLGFSSAINYKNDDIDTKLGTACPNGIDVYFDNVGGAVSESVIKQMNANSHVILCGQISLYNKDVPYPPPISGAVEQCLQNKNITRERFLVLNYADKFSTGIKQLAEWYYSNKLKVKETIAEGLDQSGLAFVSMMKGGNIGKQMVHVSDPTI